MAKEEATEAPKKTRKAKAKAEGSTAPAAPKTDFEGEINAYGFLNFRKEILAAMGLSKGAKVAVSLHVNEDGSVILRRA